MSPLKASYLEIATNYQLTAASWHRSAQHDIAIAETGERAYYHSAAECQREAAKASVLAMRYLFLALEMEG